MSELSLTSVTSAAGSRPVRTRTHLLSLRSEILIVVAITLFALALRLIDIGARINEDEGYTWLVASASGGWKWFLAKLAAYENTPPLYYLMLRAIPHNSAFWLRLPALVSGTALVPLLYWVIRSLVSSRAARIAALALAVSPLMVSYSDYARGFMLADAGLLVALLASVKLARRAGRRWWLVFLAAACWSLYSEYYTGAFLISMLAAVVFIDPHQRRDALGVGVLAALIFCPWIPQIHKMLSSVDKSKLGLPSDGVQFGALRDAIVHLAAGDHGTLGPGVARDLELLVILVVLGWCGLCVRRTKDRGLAMLLLAVPLSALALYVIAAAASVSLIQARYMTMFVPFACGVAGTALAGAAPRRGLAVATVALSVIGVLVFVQRIRRQYEPNVAPAIAAVEAARYKIILTNSSEVAFYGRHDTVVLDRPFGLGAGFPVCETCAVIDDERFAGVRPGSGPAEAFGPLVVRFHFAS